MKELYTTPEFEIMYIVNDIITESPTLGFEEDGEFEFDDMGA